MLQKKRTTAATTWLLIAVATQVNAAPSLADCKKKTDNLARLKCYDQISVVSEQSANTAATQPQSIATPTTAPTAAQQQSNSPLPAQPAPMDRPTTTTVAAPIAAIIEDDFGRTKARPSDEVEQRRAIVKSVKPDNYRKLIITLENGHVWRQSDSEPTQIKVGDNVIIQKAFFGSFLMSNGRDNRKIRVKRVE
ncbi:MAG: hypothetical protein J0M22_11110 [Gammaproteobacteria bacterium]|nr:hypothetical protein [Gammaproteobacteria bacterium]